MSYFASDTWWWPIVFIVVGGWLATDTWRWLGVLIGNRLDENSQALVLVRAIATALVAAVIARLILFPSGALAETHWALRLGAAVIGFAAFSFAGQKVFVGVGVALAVLLAGMGLGL